MVDGKQLAELAAKFESEKKFVRNEAETKAAFVIPLVQLLGYSPDSPREVRREYAAPFVQGDGKKNPDKMDLAIFDPSGNHPRFVIEVKALGVDLRAKSRQLARYMAEIPDLHFGIMTDGCDFLFYGDLDNQNMMDSDPFYRFSLDDEKTDWTKVAAELSRFHRDAFNADTLVTNAENAKFRQGMIDKLVDALSAPKEHEDFVRWLSDGIYKGKKTAGVMKRLIQITKEAVEPALLKAMSDDFVEKLRNRLASLGDNSVPQPADPEPEPEPDPAQSKKGIITTEEELAVYEMIKEICVAGAGCDPDEIIYRDTINYFSISYKRPTKWFVRYFGDSQRKAVVTALPVDETRGLCPDFEVEKAPATFGVSRVYIDSATHISRLKPVILKALGLVRSPNVRA